MAVKIGNFIPNIRQDGVLIANSCDIGKVFMEHLQQHFGHRRNSRFRVDFEKLLENKLHVELSHLERPFSLEEIKSMVFDLGGNKARDQMISRYNCLSNYGI